MFNQYMYIATTVDSKKVFYAESCDFDYPIVEIYPTKKAAAKAGHFEMSCLN